MSFYTRWVMTHASRNNSIYTTEIKTTTESSSSNLTPADCAFEFEVDDNTDLDTCIRQTTGTLRFINNGELLSILPQGNFDRMVTCKRGNGIIFEGYLGVETVTQPWAPTPYESEIPIKCMLTMLNYVNVEDSDDIDPHPFAYYLLEAMNAVGFDFESVVLPNDYENMNTILDLLIRRRWWTEEETLEGEVKHVGISWFDAFEKVLMAYGYTMVQWGKQIIIQSRTPNIYFKSYTKGQVQAIADGSNPTPISSSLQAVNFNSAFRNESDNNSTYMLPVLKNVRVKISLKEVSGQDGVANQFITWDNELSSTTSTPRIYLWKGVSTQNNITLYRQYINSSGVPTGDVPSYISIQTQNDGNTIAGAIIGSMETWNASEDNAKDSYAMPSPILFLTGGANGSRPGSSFYKNDCVPAFEITMNNSIDARFETAAIYIKASVGLCTPGSTHLPHSAINNPTSNLVLRMSAELGPNIYWNGTQWIYDSIHTNNPYTFPVTFGTDGNIVKSNDISLYNRIQYDGAGGYLMPLNLKTGWTSFGIHTPKITVYTPYDKQTELFVVLKSFNIGCANQIDVNAKDKTEVVYTAANNGEDASIELDTYTSRNDLRISALSYQPFAPVWNRNIASESALPREVIKLDNATQIPTSESLDFIPYRVYNNGMTTKYYCVGRSFKTNDDAGTVTLLQYRT